MEDRREAAQKLAQDTLAKALGQGKGRATVSRYAFVEASQGALSSTPIFGPCHARLRSLEGGLLALCTSPDTDSWSSWNNGGDSRGSGGDRPDDTSSFKEEADVFWNWLVNESHLAGMFLQKPGPEEAGARGVLMNMDAPGNLVCQAITASRMPHEFPGRVRLWYNLVQGGMNPVYALGVSETFELEYTDGTIFVKPACRRGSIHDMFESSVTTWAISNMAAVRVVCNTPSMGRKCAFGGQHGMWGSGGKSLHVLASQIKARSDAPGSVRWSWPSLSMQATGKPKGIHINDAVPQIIEVFTREIQQHG